GVLVFQSDLPTRQAFWLLFSPDGKTLAAGDRDGGVTTWEVPSGTVSWARPGVHRSFIHDMAFTPDGKRLVTASQDGVIKVLGTKNRDVVGLGGHTVVGTVQVAVSPDGKRVASTGMDRVLKIWDLSTDREILSLREH